jgi:ATP-dependent protease ClpP protease subunit
LQVIPAKLKDWFFRHWRGELPLWLSFWVIGFGVFVFNRLFSGLLLALQPVALKAVDPALTLLGTIVLRWIVLAATAIWWLIGLWRSAKQPRYKGKTRAALAALFVIAQFLFLVVGGTMMIVGRAADTIDEYRDDPQYGPRGIRVLNHGSEIEIYGTISRSVPDALSRVLASHPHVDLVSLDSKGGRVDPALRMMKIIRAHKLDTVVTSECTSACTVVFLGGKERWIAPAAKLGFHSASVWGEASETVDDRIEKALTDSGVSRKFLDNTMDSVAVTYPTASDLQAAGVITNVCLADDCSDIL